MPKKKATASHKHRLAARRAAAEQKVLCEGPRGPQVYDGFLPEYVDYSGDPIRKARRKYDQ